jgi:hypothetical protein
VTGEQEVDPTLNVREELDLYDGHVAGIVIGFIGALILFLILLYCICPIECLSIIFNIFPCFYWLCPCKSGAKREKEYDLFISYNPTNEKWVKTELVDFIRDNYLVENYILHYNEENSEEFSNYVRNVMSKSSCILLVLSDQYLMNEWNNKAFRKHLRHLITKEKTRFLTIQLHDVCDEEVEEYFRNSLQIPRHVSLEYDEFLFWRKLAYHLFTNDSVKSVLPLNTYAPTVREFDPRPDDDINFKKHNINRPIIHLHGVRDPFAKNNPVVLNYPPITKSSNSNDIMKKKLLDDTDSDRNASSPDNNVTQPSETPRRNNKARQDYVNNGFSSTAGDYSSRSIDLKDKEAKFKMEMLAKQQETQNNYADIRKSSTDMHILMPEPNPVRNKYVLDTTRRGSSSQDSYA